MIVNTLSRTLSERGLTQKDLSRMTGLTEPHISKLVHHEIVGNVLTWIRIACVLRCEVRDLFEEET